MLPLFVLVAALGVLVVILTGSAVERQPAPGPGEQPVTPTVVVATVGAPLGDPTPAFASYRTLRLRLPVDSGDVTAIGFHQASGTDTLHMKSLARDANMRLAAKHKAVPASSLATAGAETSSSIEPVWGGRVLRLWRSNRRGTPDTAVDVGANPGTDVYAPVSGTVLQVRAYKLYDKYPDYEIHIRPDGWPGVDVVLLHVDDVSVSVGDRVMGGLSRLACVRKMSDKIDIQLGGYTKNGGDHVHVQLNRAEASRGRDHLIGF